VTGFLLILRRDLMIAWRRPADVGNAVAFFVLVVVLFPLGMGPDRALLAAAGPGVIWVAALLSALLSLENVLRPDYDDGSLEQMAGSSRPFLPLVLGKIVSHWVQSGLPIVLLCPVLAAMYFLPADAIGAMILSLLLGTPTLSLVGSIGVALTLGARKGGTLLAVLILPLYVPVLVIGTLMVAAGAEGASYTAHGLMLGALLALAIGFAPLATAAGLRLSIGR